MESGKILALDHGDKVLSANLFMMKLLRDHIPKYDDGCDDFIVPEPREDWLTCLMLIIFDSCATSFNFAGTDVMPKPLSKKMLQIDDYEDCMSYWIGSFYEGVECFIPNKTPNPDILNVLKNYIATTNKEECSAYKDRKIIVTKPGSEPCYAQLLDDRNIVPKMVKMATTVDEDKVISSTRGTQRVPRNILEFNNIIAVECQSWPLQSKDWETRIRESGWPEKKVIDECISMPCCIIPKVNPKSRGDRHEWKFFFSRQEGVLMESLSDEVKMLYIITRFLLKHKQIPDGGKLTTYHFKTLLLWHCEEKSREDFGYCSLSTNVCEFINFIVKQLEKRQIQHYFLADYNMIKHIKFKAGEFNKTLTELKLLSNTSSMLEELTNITESKKYPFSVKFLASALQRKNLSNHEIYSRFQTDIISILAENVFQMVGYNQTRSNMFVKHLQSKYFTRDKITLLAVVISLHGKHLDYTQDLYGERFTKLLLYAATLYEEQRTKVQNLPPVSVISYDPEIIEKIKLIPSIAKVFCYLGLKTTIKDSYSLCRVVQEVIFKNDMQQSIFMHTMEEMFDNTESIAEKDGCNSHLICRLRHIVDYFHISNEDIEISMAKLIHMKKGEITVVHNCGKLSYIVNGVSMSRVFKYLVYELKTCVEKGYSQVKNDEVETVIFNFLRVFPEQFTLFQCLIGVIAFTLSANSNLEGIRRLISFLMNSDSLIEFTKLIEICSLMKSVLETDMPYDNMFLLAKALGQKSCKIDGVNVVSDALKHFLKPEHHLGLLMGMGLTRGVDVDTEIEIYQTWINQSIQAPVSQRNDLYFFAYCRLGHLYHIRTCTRDNEVDIPNADVMFRTAYQEDDKDLTLLVNMLVYTKNYHSKRRFLWLLEKALAVNHENMMSKLSSYYSQSAVVFEHFLDKLKMLIEECEIMFNASSVLLVNYIALKLSERQDEQFISKCVANMEKSIKELEEMPEFKGNEISEDESPVYLHKRAIGYSHAVAGSYYLDQNDTEKARLHFTKSLQKHNKGQVVKKWLNSCKPKQTSSRNVEGK